MAISKFFKSSATFPPFFRESLPNPFVSEVKKMHKVGTDTNKAEWIKLEFLMDPDNPALGSKYYRQFAIFKDGCPEDWIKCLFGDGLP
jgi:hypothetical protein